MGPGGLAALPDARRALRQDGIAGAVSTAVLAIAAFTTGGLLLAWWRPVRRNGTRTCIGPLLSVACDRGERRH